MFLTELDVINDMLATLGETPINSLDVDHPFVAAGRRFLRVASYREQAKSWWFNREHITLTPDAQGNLRTPNDTLRIDPSNPAIRLVQRGERLYDVNRASYAFANSVECTLVRHIPFEDLPSPAQTVISLSAQRDFQKAYDADVQKFQQINLELREAQMTLNAEHTRNVGANLLNRPHVVSGLAAVSPVRSAGLPTLGQSVASRRAATPAPAPEVPAETPLVDFTRLFKDNLT